VSQDFESLLDECLNRIKSGADIEACLADYPDAADELRPLLRLAIKVRSLKEVPPRSSAAMATGRQRFLQQAAVMREEAETSPLASLREWWASLFQIGPAMARGLATTLLVVLLLVASLGGGAWAVSAHSLPGDLFYPVKLAREQVQLWLTFDQMAKEELEEEIQTRRIQETKTLLEERRAVNVAFKGTVNRVAEDTLVIDGVTVTVPINVSDQALQDGTEVKVEGWTQPDGTFLAGKLEVQEPEPTATLGSGAVPVSPVASDTSTPVNTDTPIPTATPIPTDTPAPTNTFTAVPPTATFTAVPTDTPKPTDTPTATATDTETPEPTSTRTLSPTMTETSTATATPTRPRVIKLQFEGAVKQISDRMWQVGGESVLVDAKTVIDKRGGAAEVGAWARVTAVRRTDNSLLALEIVIERPAERPPEVSEFQGVIQSFNDANWVIGGTSVHIVPSTDISGTPVVGWLAWVRAVRYQTGPWIATNIRVSPPEIVVQFEGVIESISDSQWTVAGRALVITGETSIEGSPIVGAIAEVEAVQKQDGTLVARWIRVHEPPTPEPTPTTAAEEPTLPPMAKETPTATSEPAATEQPEVKPPTGRSTIYPKPTLTKVPGMAPSLFMGLQD
jgi:hypothetical protein